MQFEQPESLRHNLIKVQVTTAEASWMMSDVPTSHEDPRHEQSLTIARKIAVARRAASVALLPPGFFDDMPLIHQDIPYTEGRSEPILRLMLKNMELERIEHAQCSPDQSAPHTISVEFEPRELFLLFQRAVDTVRFESQHDPFTDYPFSQEMQDYLRQCNEAVEPSATQRAIDFRISMRDLDVATGIAMAIGQYCKEQSP